MKTLTKTQEATDRFMQTLRQYRWAVKAQRELDNNATPHYQEALRAALAASGHKKYRPHLNIEKVIKYLGQDEVARIRKECLAHYNQQSKRKQIEELDNRLFDLASQAIIPTSSTKIKVITHSTAEFSTQTSPQFYVRARIAIDQFVLTQHGIESEVIDEHDDQNRLRAQIIVVNTTEDGAEIIKRLVYQPVDYKEYMRFATKQGNIKVLRLPFNEETLRRYGLDIYGRDI